MTGRTLFDGNNRELVMHHVHTPIPDLSELAPKLSHDFIDLISDMLEKDPNDRPPNAMEVVERADEILARPTRPVVAPSAPNAAAARRRFVRRRRYGRR